MTPAEYVGGRVLLELSTDFGAMQSWRSEGRAD
jgi:hypothetical protein